MKVNEHRQGGWAVSFIIVGTVLVLGLVGGVYYLKQQSTNQEKTPVAVTTPEENKSDDTATQQEKPSGQTQPTQPPTNNSQESQQPAPAVPATPGSSSQLPETGPADTIAHLVAVVALTVAVTMYLQSRRQPLSL